MKSLFGVALVLVLACSVPQIQGYNVYCKSEYYRQRVAKNGCDSDYVGVYACLGTCGSFVLPLSNPPYFDKYCTCCKPMATTWKKVNLNCAPGVDPVVSVESVTGCACSQCS